MVINESIYTIAVNCSDTWALDVIVYRQKIMFGERRKWEWFFTLSQGSIRTAKFIIWKKKKYELNDQDESLTTNDWLPPVKEIFRIIIVTVGIILEAENIKEYSLGTALVFRAQGSFINSLLGEIQFVNMKKWWNLKGDYTRILPRLYYVKTCSYNDAVFENYDTQVSYFMVLCTEGLLFSSLSAFATGKPASYELYIATGNSDILFSDDSTMIGDFNMDMTFVGWQLILHEILNGIITYFYYVRWKPPSLNLTLIAMAIFLISLFGEVGGTLAGIVVKIKNMVAQQRESKEKVRRMSVGIFDSTVNMLKGLISIRCWLFQNLWLHILYKIGPFPASS